MTKNFWFTNAEGNKYKTKQCCIKNDEPYEVLQECIIEQFNQGTPVVRRINFLCSNCRKKLEIIKDI